MISFFYWAYLLFFSIPQLLTHTIPNIPLPHQPNVEQGATASQLSNNPWEFPRNRLDCQQVLGSGAFGLVMKAYAQGIKGCVGKMYVAVKIVKGKYFICVNLSHMEMFRVSHMVCVVVVYIESAKAHKNCMRCLWHVDKDLGSILVFYNLWTR